MTTILLLIGAVALGVVVVALFAVAWVLLQRMKDLDAVSPRAKW